MSLSENVFRKDYEVYVGRGRIPLGYTEVGVMVSGPRGWVRSQDLEISSVMQIS